MQSESIKLLQTRRFLPLFISQFLEAFNDNFFRMSLVVLITYVLAKSSLSAEIMVAGTMGLYILPFFLFSALAGQLADKFEKARLTRIIKTIEILAMCLGAYGFYTHNIFILMLTLFLLGVHSTFFGPIKYSILPDHLKTHELIGANALIEASTFLAILLGTLIGGVLIAYSFGITAVSLLGIVCALGGLGAAFYIPVAPSTQPDLKINPNFFQETFNIIKLAKSNKDIFLCILGISWFWLVGTSFLTIFPSFTKNILHGNHYVYSFFIAIFSIGIGIGSMLSEQIQRSKIDARFVPLGIFGMTIFTTDLFFAASGVKTTGLLTIGQFLTYGYSWRIIIDTFLLSICAGLFVVPLFAIVQYLAKRNQRSRIIAANNIINSLFMTVASIFIIIALKLGAPVSVFFLLLAIINLFVALITCKLLPHALLKSFVAWILKLLFRVKIDGLENYNNASPKSIILANHVSFLDGILLSAFLPDRVLFAINSKFASRWWVKPVLGLVDAFPMDPENPMATKALISNIRKNRRCFIFPEGRITVTGGLMKIYEGPGLIADKSNAAIIPIRIDGAEHSIFSRLKNKVPTRLFPQITIRILPSRKFNVSPEIKGRRRRNIISHKLYDLMTDMMFESSPYKQPLFKSLFDAKKVHGGKHVILEDIQRSAINYKSLLGKIFVLGDYIAKHSAEKEVIGILMPNAIATVVTFFGCHLYNRTPALLNFTSGAKNLISACKTAKIRTIYTSQTFIETANLGQAINLIINSGIHIVYLEDLKSKINYFHKLWGVLKSKFAKSIYQRLNSKLSADAPAVILFTSGSEGDPKGVVLSHKNILANCYQMSARVDFNTQDIGFNVLPMFHAFGLTVGTILPLIYGIKTVLYPSPLHYRLVPEIAYDINATIFFGTDTFLAGYAKHAHPYDFYNIRYIFAGAEKLKPETVRIWNEKFGIRIFEGYGATEAAPVISTNTPMHNKQGSVGRFLPNITFKLEPVENISEGGRLYIAGPNIMTGYLVNGKPGQLQKLESHWYDTGDIVYIDENQYITILDRAKRFAKIGGEMVSCTAVEIEVSNRWPDYLHAVVATEDEKKGEVLTLVTENPDANKDDLIKYFKERNLAQTMLPKQIIKIKEMFVLGSGKVDFSKVKQYVIEQLKPKLSS